jgi:uroporphyrinogen-III synthase
MGSTSSKSTLQGLRLLSVRSFSSEGGTGSFSQLLTARGANLLHCPVMNIEFPNSGADFEQIKTTIMKLCEYDKTIVVSATAARQVVDWIDQYWPQLPLKPDFFAVGESSAAVLRKFSIDVSCPSANMTSEGLLSLPELQDVKSQKIVIFRGRGGRETLAQILTERGADITYVNLYERSLCTDFNTEINEAMEDGLPLLVAHSGELLKGVVKICTPQHRAKLYATPLLVPSQRVSVFAKAQGFQHIIIAGNASPREMVLAIEEWYISQ